jgi:hypothetical protein
MLLDPTYPKKSTKAEDIESFNFLEKEVFLKDSQPSTLSSSHNYQKTTEFVILQLPNLTIE